MQEDECGSDNLADLPGAEADVAQRFERGLQQRVTTFTDGPDAVVGLVVRLLDVGELPALGFLERDGDRVDFALVAPCTTRPFLHRRRIARDQRPVPTRPTVNSLQYSTSDAVWTFRTPVTS